VNAAVWHYLSRSSGVVAVVLLVASLVWGLFFSARATGDRRRPSWWLDLHNYLGGLAFAFTALHLVAVFLDSGSGIGLVQIFVPMTASGWAWGMTWGVLATYILAVVVFTSWPKKRLSRGAWLAVHLLSIPGTVMAAGHAWMVGSSRNGLWFKALLASFVGVSVYPGVLRIARVLDRRSSRRRRAAAPVAG
jgi:sulfoxide reductase heme-binding subunit YedZ